MKIAKRSFSPSLLVCGLCVVTALAMGFTTPEARAEQAKVEQAQAGSSAEQSKGPSFRRGFWHFVRRIAHGRTKQRQLEHEMTASEATSEQAKPEQAKLEQAKVEQAKAEPTAEQFKGPSFRRGLWHFVRTIAHRKTKQRLLEREMTACVDPTQAMKATFASQSVGGCVSARPEKVDNKYVFSNRCDYMGPVSTVITVDSEEAYTEQNELAVGAMPRVELVIAKRIGDCQDASQPAHGASTLSH